MIPEYIGSARCWCVDILGVLKFKTSRVFYDLIEYRCLINLYKALDYKVVYLINVEIKTVQFVIGYGFDITADVMENA